MAEGEPLCVRCSRVQETCCQNREIYVTPGDAERISAFIGRADFCEFRLPENPEYVADDDDPLWRDCVFRSDGTRRVLKRKSNKECTFLGAMGCVLPTEVRPLVCRLYPYDYDEAGIKEELSKGCPLQLITPGLTLLDELHMDIDLGRQWHEQLYQEIRLEEHAPCPVEASTSKSQD